VAFLSPSLLCLKDKHMPWKIGDVAYEFLFWSDTEYLLRKVEIHSFPKDGGVFIKAGEEIINNTTYKGSNPGTLVRLDFHDLKTPKEIFDEIMEYGTLKVLLRVMRSISSHRKMIVYLFTVGLR
jgi:hypothetical protein